MNSNISTPDAKQSTTRFINYLASPLAGCQISVRDALLTGFEYEALDNLLNDLIMNIVIDRGSEPIQEIVFLREELRGVIHNLNRLIEGFASFGAGQRETA